MKRILALDGGGVRGALSAGMLAHVEDLLRDRPGAPKDGVLAWHFDMAAGTSTGSIIAVAVSLGYSAAEIGALYKSLCPRIFSGMRWSQGLRAKFDSARLQEALSEHLGERTLASPDLRTALLICAKRIDTGSPWLIFNNPESRFWNGDPATGAYPNRDYRLIDLIRASAAAPFYFDAARIKVTPKGGPGLFLDGGVSPHNNPALAALHVATLRPYGYEWPTGKDALSMLSVGTGGVRPRVDGRRFFARPALIQAGQALSSLLYDTVMLAITEMQALSWSPKPWTVNSELGDMADALMPPAPLLTYQRVDAPLDPNWLMEHAGIAIKPRDARRFSRMDDPRIVDEIYDIGYQAARRLIDPDDLV
jgi:hypothetical protein